MFRIALLILFTFITTNVFAGGIPITETDTGDQQIIGFFDLRDRESFIQVTNTDAVNATTIHIQLFNVGELCNENDFFDDYTPNDTHTYNIRDIVTNDGNPSGVVLPQDAYGIFVATDINFENFTLIGNMRIEDNNGYEYRTSLNGINAFAQNSNDIYVLNFSSQSGVVLSDIVGVTIAEVGSDEVTATDIVSIWTNFDIDIYDLNEVPFSCRNVVFACTDQDNPLLGALFEDVNDSGGSGSVASFEYGINDAIPNSKGGPLLCPNNVVSEGFVRMDNIEISEDATVAVIYSGLNNGNGRGTLDVAVQTPNFNN